MAHEWYGNRNDSDVVVSLVQSAVPFTRETRTNSLDQGSTAADGGGEEGSISRKRKRDTESEQDEQEVSLEDLHLHSSRLRNCSKYFDACLSERWARANSAGSKIVRLSLDVHTNVKYYKDCFSRMYSPCQVIPSIKYCLKLLQVASQISYQELVEACVCYLAAVPWSQGDEKRIRKFAKSLYYPSDCAADLSARLELPLSKTERYNRLFGLTQDVLRTYFLEAMDYDNEDTQGKFSSVFCKFMEGPCHRGLLQGILKDVNDKVEKMICCAEENVAEGELGPRRIVYRMVERINWILKVLLETGSARELVEFIVERSILSDVLHKSKDSHARMEGVDVIRSIFKEVIAGRLLLKASTRSELFRIWSWILKFGCKLDQGGRLNQEIQEIVSTFVMTFPYDQQTEFISIWEGVEWECVPDPDLEWPLYRTWVANLQKSLISLEPQQSTTQRAGENAGQFSTTPLRSSSEPASPSTSNASSDTEVHTMLRKRSWDRSYISRRDDSWGPC